MDKIKKSQDEAVEFLKSIQSLDDLKAHWPCWIVFQSAASLSWDDKLDISLKPLNKYVFSINTDIINNPRPRKRKNRKDTIDYGNICIISFKNWALKISMKTKKVKNKNTLTGKYI